MTCWYARRHTAEWFDGSAAPEVRRHLEECGACAREFAEMCQAMDALQPPARVRASPDFKERTMNKLTDRLAATDAADASRGSGGFRLPSLAWKLAAVVAAILVLAAVQFLTPRGAHSGGAMALLAQSARAMSNLESVHILARMRTLPNDNFELIGTQYEMVPVEMWKQFGDTPRWRVEKPGRVAVMDGNAAMLFFGGDQAVRGSKDAGFVEWLRPLLDAGTVLESEIAAAGREGVVGTVKEELAGGVRRLSLTIARKAQGDLTNDWCRNKSIVESDHRRVYTFDAATHRLTGLQVLVQTASGEVPVFEITEVRYNEKFDPALFTIALPDNVVWYVEPDRMPAASGAMPATPREAAVAFLEGLAAEDWERVQTVFGVSRVSDKLKQYGGGLQVISIGEPYQSGLYPGWFVPYEIRLRGGHVKKHALAVRNDNPARRFQIDGGF